ncbi:MAG: glycosyltransferase family 4 protein [candidate division WOR-3 bacterium]|nr:glycosyltransferase family 4 protein [candidate division WOR-3 bacterium]
MRIAILSSTNSVNDERIGYKEGLSLASFGHDVVVYGRRPDDSYRPHHPNLTLSPLGGGRLNLMSRIRMLMLLYRKGIEARPDVIVCVEPESAMMGMFLKRKIRAKLVFDVWECFDGLIEDRFGGLLGKAGGLALRLLLRWLAKGSDWVTVVSPVTEAQYARYRGDDRVTTIHNSSRIEWFPVSVAGATGPLVVLHEGNLDQGRGMLEMLEAIALVRQSMDVRLLLVGKVTSDDRALFDETVRRLALRDIVDMPSWMPYEEVGSAESKAHIGIIALHNTRNALGSLNNKLYNYMSCGIPIIAPKGGATQAMVERYECGCAIDTRDPHKIAAEIVRLGRDVNLRKKLGQNGRRAIETELGWHRMEEKLRFMCATLGLQDVHAVVSGTNDARPVGAQTRGLSPTEHG